jgi:UDP-2,3-diacylglucosamine pyrophosphatase LpxH
MCPPEWLTAKGRESMGNQKRILLIVSDLHLSEGQDPATRRFSPLEDFRFDNEFSAFLSTHAECAADSGSHLRLILAGDMVDFLQVVGDRKARPLRNRLFTFGSPPLRFRRLGRSTSAGDTCSKLARIVAGHKVFFEALAEFLADGHELVVLPGNHDIEWVFPDVQKAFIDALVAHAPQKVKAYIPQRIQFLPWFYLEPGLLYVEHGHQYCPLESFDYFLHPFLPEPPEELIDLPAGSFFVRYLFNHVESSWPFANNIKPPTRFIWWALKRKETWLRMPRFIRFFRETLKKATPLSPDWRKKQNAIHAKLLAGLAYKTGVSLDSLRELWGLWAPSAIHHLSKWSLAWQLIHETAGSADLIVQAACISQIMEVRYVVFGHTHEADRQALPGGPSGAEYINSGTWTKIFALRSEERRFTEQRELVFVRIDPAEPKVDLLRWRDDLGKGERVRLCHRLRGKSKRERLDF